MNSLFADFGLGSWKPVITALILPPMPLLLLALAGGWALSKARRRLGWTLLLAGVLGVWLSTCDGAADWLEDHVLRPPAPLTKPQIDELRQRVRGGERIAIVVLGGGRESAAPVNGPAALNSLSMARLRYGRWLAAQTGAPLAYSGGAGWGATAGGTTEAEYAQRIAREEFQQPLRWAERQSRDTRENAARSIEMLRQDGIRDVLLVSHAWHLPRGLRAFEQAAGSSMRVTPASVGAGSSVERPILRWLPTRSGFSHMHVVLHELVGLLAGA
jgi:uncharacterized SAM-binding protein YcdF (DUF218 family)